MVRLPHLLCFGQNCFRFLTFVSDAKFSSRPPTDVGHCGIGIAKVEQEVNRVHLVVVRREVQRGLQDLGTLSIHVTLGNQEPKIRWMETKQLRILYIVA